MRRSFSIALEITSSSRGGISGFKRTAGIGAFSRIALKITAVVAPRNGTAPVAISYSTAPKLKRSLRTSSSSPRACSGDIYATVPTAVPGLVRSASLIIGESCVDAEMFAPRVSSDDLRICLARPKSKILACPRVVTNKFAGLMSRWTMPLECAASSASAISIPNSSSNSISNGRPDILCFSVAPSRNSMTMKGWPSCWPIS